MAITATTTPPIPLAGRVRVTFAGDGGGNWVRVWITDAPAGSAYRRKIDATPGTLADGLGRVQVWEGDPAQAQWEAEFDRPGVYVLAAQEFTRGASVYGGSYSGSPQGLQSETAIGSESVVSVYIAQQFRARFGVVGRGASDLVYTVHGDSIVETASSDGVRTPRFESHSSLLAEAAAAAVLSEYTLLGTTGTVFGDFAELATTLRVKFDAHRTQGGVHPANDTDNVLGAEWSPASSPAGLVACVNKIRDALYRHITNDSGTGPGSGDFHQSGGVDVIGWPAIPALSSATDLESVGPLLAGLLMMYEAHRAVGSGAGHSAADSTNTIDATSAWIGAQQAYLQAISILAPGSVPATVHPGALRAAILGHRGER